MVSPARIQTNRLLAKAFNLNDFLDPTRLAHDELQYYNDLTRSFDKIINHYIDWLDSSEAKKLFYEEIQNREEYFQTIDSDLDDIIQDTSLSADRIIEKVYRKGLSYGYKDINRLPVFNDACKYGLKATQEYNFELITNVSNDLRDSIKHHIFRGIAEGQSIHEVARAITDSGLKPIEGKTLSAYQRASLIARTEIARSMTTGRLQSYANYGVKKVKILTAGDDNVCPICRKAEKKIYTLEEASNLIPFHPACRCSIIAHIEHYTIPEKPIEHPQTIDLTPNIYSTGKHEGFFNVKGTGSIKLVESNKNVKVDLYAGDELDIDDDGEELFNKYVFDNGLEIYISEDYLFEKLHLIKKAYEDLPDVMKRKVDKIIVSGQQLRLKDGSRVGGYISPNALDNRIIIGYNTSVGQVGTFLHESAHLLEYDENFYISNSREYITACIKDSQKRKEAGEKEIAPKGQKDFIKKVKNGDKNAINRPLSEDLAISVKEYLSDPDNFKKKYPKRGEVIEKILDGTFKATEIDLPFGTIINQVFK